MQMLPVDEDGDPGVAMGRPTRPRLALAYLATLVAVVGLPRLVLYASLGRTRRAERRTRARHSRAHPVTGDTPGTPARIAIADLAALLLGVPAAYALAGYALGPAREARARQQRFAVAASHELRTPLTVLLGTLESALLRRRTPEQYEDVLRRATAEAAHLGALLDEVLTLAHAERGTETRAVEPLDLRAVARAAVEDVRALATDKGQTLAVALDAPLPVCGNARALRQAVAGLLDNAVIYTPAGGTIRLSGRRGRGRVLLTIRDNGPGIAPEHLPHLREPFYRVDRTRPDSARHAGLGLTHADRITRMHSGYLAIDSHVGLGSAFTLTLPLDHVREHTVDDGQEAEKIIGTASSH